MSSFVDATLPHMANTALVIWCGNAFSRCCSIRRAGFTHRRPTMLSARPRYLTELLSDILATRHSRWTEALYYPLLGCCWAIAWPLVQGALPVQTAWHRGLPGAILAMAVFCVQHRITLYISWITPPLYLCARWPPRSHFYYSRSLLDSGSSRCAL